MSIPPYFESQPLVCFHPSTTSSSSSSAAAPPPPSLKMTKTNPPSLSFLFLLIILFHVNSQTSSNSEQAILLQFKQYWSNPSSLSHWSPNSTSAHCTWPEITCTNNSVTRLYVPFANITGQIPPFICDLRNLTHIELQNNNITGSFPRFLYNCSNLQYLDLSQNYLVGRIPDDIDRLSPRLLRYLSLGANNFTGDIPAAVGRFPELTSLYIFQTLINGSFPPEIGNLSNLEHLGLAFNRFIPSSIPSSFMNLTKLKTLWMTESNLIGQIPEFITDLTALEFLDLSVNNLTGNIPTNLFLLRNLTSVYLYLNSLSGSIPQSVEALDLNVIDLSANNLTGTIPEDFGMLTKLSILSLFYNNLSGEIPVSMSRLPALEDVRVFSNNLSGALPPDFGRFSRLWRFEFDSNRLIGTLPESLCHNGVLAGVAVFDNDLSGEIPNSLGNCSSLVAVLLNGNRFSGAIPDGLWMSFNLTQLIISDNSFSGQLPYQLGSNLSLLDISNNNFSGEISAGVSSWNSLRVFRASGNNFTGPIPQELTALPSLETLLLDRNRLSGQFPANITSWTWLTSLNLSRNQLSGRIPREIGFLPRLSVLDLSENEFSSQIPPEVGFLRLTSLNLSSNRLTGRIPVNFETGVFNSSFLNNPDLCASNPSLGLNTCSSNTRRSSNVSPQFIIVVTSVALVIIVLAMLFSLYVIRGYRKRKMGSNSTWKLTSFQRLNFTESTILSSLTDNNLIGSGGSGKVYRVAINRSDECVSVKRIWNSKKLEQTLEKEFLSEVRILSSIRHSNVIKLMCFISNDNSKLLVYEYMENRSLDRWLHGKGTSSSISALVHHVELDWPKRLHIAVGAARGLCYMHHDCSPPIVHRDVKSSNILLDSDFNAKIADFGLARILIKHDEPNTMSVVAGSFGYMAPEYAHTRRVTEKIDVYSFGVVLLELATGREANYGDEHTSLAEWAWRHIQEGKPIVDALDEDIKEPRYLDEMSGVFKLGIICTGTLPSTRPSMKEVLQILLRCSHLAAFGEKNIGSEVDSLPLLKNSKRERALESDDGDLALIV